MPSWYIKASIQGVLSILPQSHRWNYIFQRHISKGLRLSDRYFETKLEICQRHQQNYQTYGVKPLQKVVELGTGWLPIIPIGFYLCGVEQVTSVDVTPLMQDILIYETLEHFIKYADEGRLSAFLPDAKPERLEYIRELVNQNENFDGENALKSLGITTLIADARHSRIEEVDLFASNTTLEHIPEDIIMGIFQNFHQILSTDGLMSHLIDLSDHYSHFDRRIDAYNFLKFSPMMWRIFNNKLHYQNRLRISDYRALVQDSGFDLLVEENQPKTTDAVDNIQVAPEFQHYSQDDLMVTTSWMVCRPRV